jgi:transposase, IS6 family
MFAVQEEPGEASADRAPALAAVIAELLPAAIDHSERCANNRMECDQGRLRARLRPMRCSKTFRSVRTVIGGQVFIQNLRRGHYELGVEARQS